MDTDENSLGVRDYREKSNFIKKDLPVCWTCILKEFVKVVQGLACVVKRLIQGFRVFERDGGVLRLNR